MRWIMGMTTACCAFTIALVAGCQVTTREETPPARPAAKRDDVEAQQTVTSTNDDGIWTAMASATGGKRTVSGLATFNGPTGKTRGMGMCLVQRYGPQTIGVTCNTADECDSAPEVIPAGGHRYCLAPSNKGTKYCHFRPGAQSN